MSKLLSIGTSSWSSADWVGTFYPDKMKPTEFLRFYATKYDTVEVDSTFYRLPTAWLCKKWAKDTPETFRFALKVTRDITHDKVLVGCEEEWEKFLGAVGELGPRLGFIVFQFGYFNCVARHTIEVMFPFTLRAHARSTPSRRRPWTHELGNII